MKSSSICVALVTNRAFLERCLYTIWQLRFFGKYRGDIALIVGDDLVSSIPMLEKLKLKIIPKYFSDIDRTRENRLLREAPGTVETQITKGFQFHKFYCFSEFFKRWDKVLYLDSKMRIFSSIRPILNLDCAGSLVAHADAFPDFQQTLGDQFNLKDFPETGDKISSIVPLASEYFQTTMMYFDTGIIDDQTVSELIELSRAFPNSNTNDQGIINIWALPRNLWARLPTDKQGRRYLYDFYERKKRKSEDYIMLKYPRKLKVKGLRRLSQALFEIYRRVALAALERTTAPHGQGTQNSEKF